MTIAGTETIARRLFIAVLAGAAVTPPLAWALNQVPSLLDHFILGCNDLDRGIDFVEQRTGVRAAFGGVHPGRGTRNALLSLGERRYLEIMAPDPAQSGALQIPKLRDLSEPRIVGWAAHPGDLNEFSAHLRKAGILFEGPRNGSRQRPDGSVLHWKSLNLKDDEAGLLPFFIEWSADSLHPSVDSPKGCEVQRFAAATPDPDAARKTLALLNLDISVALAKKTEIQATITGPKGQASLAS